MEWKWNHGEVSKYTRKMFRREEKCVFGRKGFRYFFYWNSFLGAYAYLFTTFSYKCVRHVYGLFCFLFIKNYFQWFFSPEQTNGYDSLDRLFVSLTLHAPKAKAYRKKALPWSVKVSLKNLENDLLLCLAENIKYQTIDFIDWKYEEEKEMCEIIRRKTVKKLRIPFFIFDRTALFDNLLAMKFFQGRISQLKSP